MMEPTSISVKQLLAHDENLRSLVYSLLLDDSRVDDVLQETWMVALTRPPHSIQALGVWLRRVARNFAFHQKREESRRVSREKRAARSEWIPAVCTEEERESASRSVVKNVLGLKEPYQSVIVLRFFEDLTPTEIAERTGTPLQTVKTRLKRALKMLRSRLEVKFAGENRSWALAILPVLKEPGEGAVTLASVKISVAALLLVGLGIFLWRPQFDRGETGGQAPAVAAATGEGFGEEVRTLPFSDTPPATRNPGMGSKSLVPAQPRNVRSTSHAVNTWSNRLGFTAMWAGKAAGYGIALEPKEVVADLPLNHRGQTLFRARLSATPHLRYYFHVLSYNAEGAASSTVRVGPYLIDTVPPEEPADVVCLSHEPGVWSRKGKLEVEWIPLEPDDGSPLGGYSAVVTRKQRFTPEARRNLGVVNRFSTRLQSSHRPYYFALRAVDAAGNFGPAAHAGPFLVDGCKPEKGRILVQGPATATGGREVVLTDLTAIEPHSGLNRMRFSNNGADWSPWEPYAGTRTGWDLTKYGAGKTRASRVFVQYEDAAGNRSDPASCATSFRPVRVARVFPDRGTLIGGDIVTLIGTGFRKGITRVFFAGVPAQYVQVKSPMELICTTPTHLAWEYVDVSVSVSGKSAVLEDGYNYVGAEIIARGDPTIAEPLPVSFRAPVDGGHHYCAGASLGTGPIMLKPHAPLELSTDPLLFKTSQDEIPDIFESFRGCLDPEGLATATIFVPNAPTLVGTRFHAAFITLDERKPLGVRTVSTTRSFRILGR